MKAITYMEYGPPDVLHVTEVAKPTPGDDEILIRLRAASVNAYDWRLMRGRPLFTRFLMGGLRRPKTTRPGVDLAGQVEAVGKNVTEFKPGDDVFGVSSGTFAEYVCAIEGNLVPKPANISFEAAAAVPLAALTALQGLRDKGHIQQGQKVLVDGAAGGVGTFAVQIAKSFGAEVTAVCSTGHLDTARSIGADHVVDYTREDVTRSGRRYDLILAANAYHSIFGYRRALGKDGTFVMAGGGWAQIFQAMLLGPLLSLMGSKKMSFLFAKRSKTDFVLLKDLMAAGKIVPVIERHYPLSEVADAVRYLEQGHAGGKVVITSDPAGAAKA